MTQLIAHRADLRTLACMLLATVVAVAHWLLGHFNMGLFAASMALSFSVSTMHHNHAHRAIWRSRVLNHATDAWFTLFQGHPGYVFETMHVDNHHRFHNGREDVTRTDRFRAGNDLLGLLRHPVEFVIAAAPHIVARVRRASGGDLAGILAHYALLIGVDALALLVDWRAALYVVLLPQAGALFWLLASNYLQHADTRGDSEFEHSRSFLGFINVPGFNVGYHAAHHHAPDAHWSELPEVHARLAPHLPPVLNERSFAWYVLRTFFLSLAWRRFRSAPLASNGQRT